MPSRRARKKKTIAKNATRNACQLERLELLGAPVDGRPLAAGREVKIDPDGTSTITEVAVVPNAIVVVTTAATEVEVEVAYWVSRDVTAVEDTERLAELCVEETWNDTVVVVPSSTRLLKKAVEEAVGSTEEGNPDAEVLPAPVVTPPACGAIGKE